MFAVLWHVPEHEGLATSCKGNFLVYHFCCSYPWLGLSKECNVYTSWGYQSLRAPLDLFYESRRFYWVFKILANLLLSNWLSMFIVIRFA